MGTHHEQGVDDSQPAMRPLDGRNKGVCMCVIVRCANGNEEEGGHVETERGHPGTQGLRQDLQDRTEGEHGAQVEVLAEVGVGEGCDDPASKRGCLCR